MPIEEAAEFFRPISRIARHLETLVDVGLGYVRLGQPAPTLSGGEAQRVKLASELQKRSTGRTIYVLDEPTTGLHFEDVRKLLGVLHSLVDKGNSVLVIEHNLDVIKTADWVIDMGPRAASGGGTVVAEGTPEAIARTPGSYTGQFLRPHLGIDGAASDVPAPARPKRGRTAVGRSPVTVAELRTERLVLRDWRDEDLDAFAALNADPEVMRWFVAPLSRPESDALAARIRADLAAHGWGLWAVEVPGVAAFAGFVGLAEQTFPARFTPAVEVGWRLSRAWWGRGWASEAARATTLVRFRRTGPGRDRLDDGCRQRALPRGDGKARDDAGSRGGLRPPPGPGGASPAPPRPVPTAPSGGRLSGRIPADRDRSAGFVHPGSEADPHDQTLRRLHPGHRLTPRFGAGLVEQRVAGVGELLRRRRYRLDGGHLELDARLRHRPVGRPLGRAEAGLRRLRERPHAEVPGTADLLTEDVLVLLAGALQREAQRVDVQPAAGGRVRGDHRHAGDEADVHLPHPAAPRAGAERSR